jgi:hypothetical protein
MVYACVGMHVAAGDVAYIANMQDATPALGVFGKSDPGLHTVTGTGLAM